MSLKDKTSIYQPPTPKTRKPRNVLGNLLDQAMVVKNSSQAGKSPNSNLLPQATNIKSNFVEGNPTSNKFSQTVSVSNVSPTFHKSSKAGQTNNAFFNMGKASQFSSGGQFERSYSGKTVSSGASVAPTLTFMQLFFQRVKNAGGTSENQTPMTAFYNNINSIEI